MLYIVCLGESEEFNKKLSLETRRRYFLIGVYHKRWVRYYIEEGRDTEFITAYIDYYYNRRNRPYPEENKFEKLYRETNHVQPIDQQPH